MGALGPCKLEPWSRVAGLPGGAGDKSCHAWRTNTWHVVWGDAKGPSSRRSLGSAAAANSGIVALQRVRKARRIRRGHCVTTGSCSSRSSSRNRNSNSCCCSCGSWLVAARWFPTFGPWTFARLASQPFAGGGRSASFWVDRQLVAQVLLAPRDLAGLQT